MGDPIPANPMQLGAILVPALPIVVGPNEFGQGGGDPQTHTFAYLTG